MFPVVDSKGPKHGEANRSGNEMRKKAKLG